MLGENRLITQEKVGVNTEIYYLENSYDKSNSITFSEEIAKTKDEMQSNEFLELLNTNEEIWIKDTNNINLGYPILYWQKSVNLTGFFHLHIVISTTFVV